MNKQQVKELIKQKLFLHEAKCTELERFETFKVTCWSGEVLVTVHHNIGAHGFHSAAIVICYMDDPLEVRVYDGYDRAIAKADRLNHEFEWIATEISNECFTWNDDLVGELVFG